MSTQSQLQSKFSEVLAERLEQKGLGIRDLANIAEITYEHARRLVRGEGVPSKHVLKIICQSLGLNFKEMERLTVSAQLQRRYGDIPLELAGKKPSLEPIERVWDNLSKQQQEDATLMITGWAKAARARK